MFKMTVMADIGIQVPDAVHRIESVTVKASDRMTFAVRAYATEETTYVVATPGDFVEIPYDPAGGDVFAQAYAYVLALPEFSTAVPISDSAE
ncbi:hypothetical protein [Chitinasiproducens palmae]|uniref:Uncharacterized protein n=1 Tax=Chitinasiproducens palmae TaxID=1770053 RepID=A0A1H2PRR6_9BURK|nr:hypothetical protein [Chitinasiproducens palmae]SDV49181.1 hypothetical protein SAMN05216551_107133 [Chitinasiproducens palmae]